MLEDKGVYDLIEALNLLKNQGKSIIMTFAGTTDSSNPRSLKLEEIQNWHKLGLINYKGFVSNTLSLYQDHDVIVLPTYYREGVPLSLIEAASTGLAIITTDMPGCREILKHELNGILIPPRNPQELAKAINKMNDEPFRVPKYAKQSRKRVLEIFDKEIVNKKTLEFYK